MFANPEQILQRVIDQALGSSKGDSSTPAPTEDLVADLIGRYLGPMMGDGTQESPLLDYVSAALSHYAELQERNATLAAALGACDCFGESTVCETCHGGGFPGWSVPDEELFSDWVRPALAALARSRSAGGTNVARLSTVIAADKRRGD